MRRFSDDLNTPLEERGTAPYEWELPFSETIQAQTEQAVDEGTFPTLSRDYQLEFGSQQGFQPLSEIAAASRGEPAKKGDSRERISIEQAKTEFPGLEIAPLFTDTITRGYANYLYQRKAKNQVRDMKAAQGNPAVGFAAGVGASLVDPADLALNLTLSGVGAAKYAHTALKAGRLPSYSAAQRYYRMYQSNSILNNGIVSGAVEGFAGAVATEPIYQASKRATEGRVDLAQSAASLAISPLVGGVVGGLSDYLTRTPVAKRKDVPNPSIFDQPNLELRATMNAAEGEPIRAVDSINVPEQRQKLSDAEKQVTSKIEELDNYSGGLKPPLATVTPAVAQAVKKPVDVAPGFPIVGGVITSGFGKRKRPTAGASVDHKGWDVGAPAGTPIVPHIGGVVEVVKTPAQSGGYGNQVIIRQDDGYLVSYAHNKVNLVKPRQRIKPGTVIAEVGSTGRSTGPHTHIEVTGPDGKLVDPEKYFGNTPKKGKGKKAPKTAPEEAGPPVRPGEVDSIVDHPAVQNFITPAEEALLNTSVREFPARVDEIINGLREDFAEYQAIPRRKGYRDEARLEALHQKMAEDWGSFQALVPAAQRMELPAFDKRSQMISPKNLERMSEQLRAFNPETVFDSAGQFNEMGVSELRNWYTTKNAELKAAYTKVKNANYRPETIKKNKEIIAELASDVDVAFLRLRQLGVTDIEPDAVSTAAFRSVLAEQNPGIAALLQETDSPIPYYETKRQILENVKERIAAARQMVENAETAPKAKHINSVNFDGYDEAVQRLETDGKITDILAAQQEQLTSIQKDIDQMVQFQLIKESDAEHLRTKLQNDAPTLSDAEIDTAVRQIGIFCQNEKGG